jgi:hypothetical protein
LPDGNVVAKAVLCGVRKARIELYVVGVALVGGWWHQDT